MEKIWIVRKGFKVESGMGKPEGERPYMPGYEGDPVLTEAEVDYKGDHYFTIHNPVNLLGAFQHWNDKEMLPIEQSDRTSYYSTLNEAVAAYAVLVKQREAAAKNELNRCWAQGMAYAKFVLDHQEYTPHA